MEIEIIDSYDVVTCRICGRKSKRIYGGHLKYHGLTSEEYLKMFPNAPLMAKVDTEKMGKHMREDKYKKMFSKKISGENNPNHRSKTTEDERKSRSPFSKDFAKYKNFENKEEMVSNFVKEALKNRITPLQKEYYINQGFSYEESIKMVSDRQRTFTLEKCIEKYGKEFGELKFTERQNIWINSLHKNGNMKNGFSKASQELFENILLNYDISDRIDVFFATKNGEFKINKIEGGICMYDFADIKRKKIIEYNGDIYHANPNIYGKNDRPHPFRTGFTSEYIWQKDADKSNLAKDNGFEILIIWDSEYRKNKKEVLDKCLHFLKL